MIFADTIDQNPYDQINIQFELIANTYHWRFVGQILT